MSVQPLNEPQEGAVLSLHAAVKGFDDTRSSIYCLVDPEQKARYVLCMKAASSFYRTLHVGVPPMRGPMSPGTVYTWTIPALIHPCPYCGWRG